VAERPDGDCLRIRYVQERANFSLDVDFELAAHGITGLFGPSGAGKTSLLRCIAGLEKADRGRLSVRGAVLEDTDRGVWLPSEKRHIGYVFQEARLFPHLSIDANLCYGAKRTQKKQTQDEYRRVVDMLDLESLLERSTTALSGGEAQRVAIGRALLSGPNLLLMDEPFASLDETRKSELLPYLDRLHQDAGIPIIYVSHNIDEICQLCDQLAVMLDGAVAGHGNLQAVLLEADLPVLGGKEAGSVIRARVETTDSEHELTLLGGGGTRLCVPGVSLRIGSSVSLRIRANDVSLCLDRPVRTSILNVLDARVETLHDEPGGTVLVRLRVGEEAILARITRKSCVELSLQVGSNVFAQIKSIAIRQRD
jgi:molybdate transport system ATP-binding protein